MYSELLNFKDIHIFSKVVAFLLGCFAIIFVKNPLFLIMFSFLFYLCFGSKLVLLFELLGIIICFVNHGFVPVLKLSFFISLVLLFIKMIDFHQFRYFVESLFYKRNHSKITYLVLYICYFFEYFKKYFKEFWALLKGYGKKIGFKQFKYIFVESFKKTKIQIEHILTLYRYRFYNSYPSRTYLEKEEITSIDIKYVLIFAILFFLIYVYGR